MYTIYHNSRCSKSRQTLALLEEKGVEPSIIDYQATPLEAPAIKELLTKLGLGIRDIIRTGEEAYKSEGLSNPDLTENQLIDAIVAYPKLLQRPIVTKGDKAIIGRPPENVLDLIKN
jgi:arsenate reductase